MKQSLLLSWERVQSRKQGINFYKVSKVELPSHAQLILRFSFHVYIVTPQNFTTNILFHFYFHFSGHFQSKGHDVHVPTIICTRIETITISGGRDNDEINTYCNECDSMSATVGFSS